MRRRDLLRAGTLAAVASCLDLDGEERRRARERSGATPRKAGRNLREGQYEIGVGVRSITPTPELIDAGRIYLWGFGFRDTPVSGTTAVLDQLWSRAFVLCDANGGAMVIASLDLGAVDPAFTNRVRARVAASCGVPWESVAVAVTHTHSAPVVLSLPAWNPGVDRPDPAYMSFLEDQVCGSIEDAWRGTKPGTLAFSRGEVVIGANRHFKGGVYDRTLDVLRAADANENTIAVLFTHACHPVCLRGQQISSDYPGVARDAVEQATGAKAVFLQGYAGTINPASGYVETGKALGAAVVQLLRTMEPIAGDVSAVTAGVEVPLEPLDPQVLEQALDSPEKPVSRWAKHLKEAGEAVPASLPVELQGFRVGVFPNAWRIALSSHEVVAEFAAPVRALRPYERFSLVGYCNRELSYLPDSKVLDSPAKVFPPGTANYEGGNSFIWYGHRGPITHEVDRLFVSANEKLFGPVWRSIGTAPRVVAMTSLNGRLYAATADNRLLWRDAVETEATWNALGNAEEIAAMAAANGKLYCATRSNRLLRSDPVHQDPWKDIGPAEQVAGMAALGGMLYCATRDGRLLRRPASARRARWAEIGEARDAIAMSASEDHLFSVTALEDLSWREALPGDATWKRFGRAEHVTGMARIGRNLFVATKEGALRVRDLV